MSMTRRDRCINLLEQCWPQSWPRLAHDDGMRRLIIDMMVVAAAAEKYELFVPKRVSFVLEKIRNASGAVAFDIGANYCP